MNETDAEDRPVAFNEDGAHHVIAKVSSELVDIGFTIPGQTPTYWNPGPGPGRSGHEHDWSRSTGRTMATNLAAAATALRAHSMPALG